MQQDREALLAFNRLALSYSTRRYDSAVCCSKMSRDAFLREALYEADNALEKFAAAPRECACLQDGGQSRWWIANVCFILLFCIIWVLTTSIFVYVCFVDCCFAATCKLLSKYAARPWSANLHLMQPWIYSQLATGCCRTFQHRHCLICT